MASNVEWIIVGKFGRVQGLNGFIRVVSYTEPKENIVSYSPWYAKIDDNILPIKLLETDKNNKFTLVKVDGYTEREQVAALTNVEILIHSSQLPKLPADEYYWHDLVGMEVVDDKGLKLGHVEELMATGSNDVLVVSGEKRVLIPYLRDEYIVSIDSENNLITVKWDEDI
ncbi:MAG: ribosome maturation factor RimM [Legionellaceae bacterium]|nr:ribosome maturation factor RimM [Legionellaceae bacterium]